MALKREIDVLVVGAGPVGLFTALLLAARGRSVQIVDREWRGSVHSYALALHPQSLRLLDEHGVADELVSQGHRIERVAFYRGAERVGVLDFSQLGGPFPFVLVAPQSALEQALEQRLQKLGVRVFWNHQALDISQDPETVTTRVGRLEKYSMGYPIARTEWMITREIDVRSSFLVGTDGYHSFVRKSIDAAFEHQAGAEAFSVYEFPTRIDFQHEARVVFHEGTTNVVWPLDARRGRWSFQIDQAAPPAPTVDALKELIRARVPWFDAAVEEVYWTTTALFERRLVDHFGRGRIWLAGDAAHITGPVGVQSMNVGLREAHDLTERFSAALKQNGDPSTLAHYETERLAEWRALLGLSGSPQPSGKSADWLDDLAPRVVPCVPASGADLQALIGQIGLRLA